MSYYKLVIKNSESLVDRIEAENLEEAIELFRIRKRLDEKSFNEIYGVVKDEE